MNTITKIIFLVMLSLFSYSATAQTKKNEKAVIKTSISCDHCKQCETCGKNFGERLMDVSGVKMYEIDEKQKTITVYYDGRKTNIDAIRKVISDSGFDADDLKANPVAYEKLDGCCKL